MSLCLAEHPGNKCSFAGYFGGFYVKFMQVFCVNADVIVQLSDEIYVFGVHPVFVDSYRNFRTSKRSFFKGIEINIFCVTCSYCQ